MLLKFRDLFLPTLQPFQNKDSNIVLIGKPEKFPSKTFNLEGPPWFCYCWWFQPEIRRPAPVEVGSWNPTFFFAGEKPSLKLTYHSLMDGNGETTIFYVCK